MKAWTFAVVPDEAAVVPEAAEAPEDDVAELDAAAVTALCAPMVCCSDCRMLLNKGEDAPTGNWPIVTPLVLPSAPELFDVDDAVALVFTPCAPLRWRWNEAAGLPVIGLEEMALKLMGNPWS